MNWQIEGKKKNGKPGKFPIIGGPDTDKEVRELVGVTHPGFTVDKATPDRTPDVEPAPSEEKQSKAQR